MLSLLVGPIAAWLVSGAALAAYWHGPRTPANAPHHWSGTAVPMALTWPVVAATLLGQRSSACCDVWRDRGRRDSEEGGFPIPSSVFAISAQ